MLFINKKQKEILEWGSIRRIVEFLNTQKFTAEDAVRGIDTIIFLMEDVCEIDLFDIPNFRFVPGGADVEYTKEWIPKVKSEYTLPNSPEALVLDLLGTYFLINKENNSFIQSLQCYGVIAHQLWGPLMQEDMQLQQFPRFTVRVLLVAFLAMIQSMASFKFPTMPPSHFHKRKFDNFHIHEPKDFIVID